MVMGKWAKVCVNEFRNLLNCLEYVIDSNNFLF